jgi:hypothetical protein
MTRYPDTARRGFEHCSLARTSLPEHLVRSLLELNEQFLLLLLEQASTLEAHSNLMLRQFRALWRQLTRTGRERMAGCPYLLADLGFTEVRRWCGHERFVKDQEPPEYAPFFTVSGVAGMARQVFTYAWDLARTEEGGARIVLGMPAHCTSQIKVLTVSEIYDLADAHRHWLCPRWPRGGKVWRDLLLAAASGDVPALERARGHGHDLIEAESRAATLKASQGRRL